jgi:hypothetical protein
MAPPVHPSRRQADVRAEASELRERLLAAETARDSARLRLRQLRQAVADGGGSAALSALHTGALDGTLMRASTPEGGGGTEGGAGSGSPGAARGRASEASSATELPGGGGAAAAAAGDEADADAEGDVDVVAEMRARISELEAELREARSLQRAQSTMLRAGTADAVAAAVAAAAATVRRGGGPPRGGPAARFRAATGDAAPLALPGDAGGNGAASTPLTPAARSHDALTVPLEVRGLATLCKL